MNFTKILSGNSKRNNTNIIVLDLSVTLPVSEYPVLERCLTYLNGPDADSMQLLVNSNDTVTTVSHNKISFNSSNYN